MSLQAEKDQHAPQHEEITQISPVHAGRALRARSDDLSIWQSVKSYKLISTVAMLAAFSASLDGYQITLNGGIVSNKGFIAQFAAAGTTVLAGKWVSAWGGIQSTGQTLGQIVSPSQVF